jgi:hypothetical protein
LYNKGHRNEGETNRRLFAKASDQLKNSYSEFIKKCGEELERDCLLIGMELASIGSHSLRKGVATFLSGIPGGPSAKVQLQPQGSERRHERQHESSQITRSGDQTAQRNEIAALLQRESIHNTPQPLPLEFCQCGDKMPANSCHKCRKCNRSMHAFCGNDHEGEGYGASSICKWCC